MARGAVLGGAAPTLLAGAAGFALVLLSADPQARNAAACALSPGQAERSEPAPTVVSEPAVFIGRLELTPDPQHGHGLVVATATEEVVIADNDVARSLREYAGEVVAVQGRLIERPEGPALMIVREFRVLGLAPRRSSEPLPPARGTTVAC